MMRRRLAVLDEGERVIAEKPRGKERAGVEGGYTGPGDSQEDQETPQTQRGKGSPCNTKGRSCSCLYTSPVKRNKGKMCGEDVGHTCQTVVRRYTRRGRCSGVAG